MTSTNTTSRTRFTIDFISDFLVFLSLSRPLRHSIVHRYDRIRVRLSIAGVPLACDIIDLCSMIIPRSHPRPSPPPLPNTRE